MPGTALHNPTEDEASQQQQEDHQHSPTMTKYTTLSIQYRLIHVEAIVSALLSSIVDMPIGRYHRRDTSEAHGSISWRTFHRCQFHVCPNYEVPRILASTLKSLTVNTIESSFFTMNCLFWTSRDADVNVMNDVLMLMLLFVLVLWCRERLSRSSREKRDWGFVIFFPVCGFRASTTRLDIIIIRT